MNFTKCKDRYDNVLTDEDKIRIHLMMLKGIPVGVISDEYFLTRQFIISKHQLLVDKTIGISVNGKTSAYYENEMNYGKLDLEYNFELLSENEIKFYENK